MQNNKILMDNNKKLMETNLKNKKSLHTKQQFFNNQFHSLLLGVFKHKHIKKTHCLKRAILQGCSVKTHKKCHTPLATKPCLKQVFALRVTIPHA